MKATILLAIAIFLAVAPEPDADVISELTHRLIVLDRPAALQANETTDETDRPNRGHDETD